MKNSMFIGLGGTGDSIVKALRRVLSERRVVLVTSSDGVDHDWKKWVHENGPYRIGYCPRPGGLPDARPEAPEENQSTIAKECPDKSNIYLCFGKQYRIGMDNGTDTDDGGSLHVYRHERTSISSTAGRSDFSAKSTGESCLDTSYDFVSISLPQTGISRDGGESDAESSVGIVGPDAEYERMPNFLTRMLDGLSKAWPSDTASLSVEVAREPGKETASLGLLGAAGCGKSSAIHSITEPYFPALRDEVDLEPQCIVSLIGERGAFLFSHQIGHGRRTDHRLNALSGKSHPEKAIARTESERQLMGIIEHPKVVGIMDGASTVGCCFAHFWDEHNLTSAHKIAVAIHGMQHANQAIAHGDMNAANVFINEMDGKAVGKLIDFGIAKALDAFSEAALYCSYLLRMVMHTQHWPSLDNAGAAALYTIDALDFIHYGSLTGNTPLPAGVLRQGTFNRIFEANSRCSGSRTVRHTDFMRQLATLGPFWSAINRTLPNAPSDWNTIIAHVVGHCWWRDCEKLNIAERKAEFLKPALVQEVQESSDTTVSEIERSLQLLAMPLSDGAEVSTWKKRTTKIMPHNLLDDDGSSLNTDGFRVMQLPANQYKLAKASKSNRKRFQKVLLRGIASRFSL